MTNITRIYPGIERACVEMAYDNGGVHRGRSEQQVRKECRAFIETLNYKAYLPAIDQWLKDLDDETLSIAIAGEYSEINELMEQAPPKTNKFLNEYFDHVC